MIRLEEDSTDIGMWGGGVTHSTSVTCVCGTTTSHSHLLAAPCAFCSGTLLLHGRSGAVLTGEQINLLGSIPAAAAATLQCR